jgi:hypothetical protein
MKASVLPAANVSIAVLSSCPLAAVARENKSAYQPQARHTPRLTAYFRWLLIKNLCNISHLVSGEIILKFAVILLFFSVASLFSQIPIPENGCFHSAFSAYGHTHFEQLAQNYPNPFNAVTIIEYELPVIPDMQNAYVSLTVYDLMGREVVKPVYERYSAGLRKISFDAAGLAAGYYLYQLQAGSYKSTRKMLLLK